MQRLHGANAQCGRILAACVVLLGLMGGGFGSAMAFDETGALVRPQPALLEMSEGAIATLDIVIENAKDVYGIDVRGRFDPAIIEVVDADPNKEGVQIKPGAFPKPDFLVRNAADNRVGTLQYVTTQLNPTLPVNGSGIVFSIQFRGKAHGETALTIDSVQMADRLGRALAVRATHGRIKVTQAESPVSSPGATQPAPSPALSPLSPASMEPSATPVGASAPGTAIPTSVPRATMPAAGSVPTMTPVPASGSSGAGPVNCLGGSLLPALGLLGFAGWRFVRRSRRRD
jgi:hypothetical protein